MFWCANMHSTLKFLIVLNFSIDHNLSPSESAKTAAPIEHVKNIRKQKVCLF